MNGYETLEKKGRDIVKSIFHKVEFKAGTVNDRFDLEINTLNGRSLIEVKYRPNMLSSDFDTDILEYEKLSALRNEDSDANYFYMMLFKDKVARLYDLKKINIVNCYLNVKSCPVSSIENKGYIDKLMIELPVNQAIIYKWKD